MKYKTQWTHYCAFSDETGPFVTSSHNSSILLFEKKDWWKVICIKIKGIKKKKKKAERTRQSAEYFLVWEVYDYPSGCCSTDEFCVYDFCIQDFRGKFTT